MTKWEYKEMDGDWLTIEELDGLGAEGWELCSHEAYTQLPFKPHRSKGEPTPEPIACCHYLFKREL